MRNASAWPCAVAAPSLPLQSPFFSAFTKAFSSFAIAFARHGRSGPAPFWIDFAWQPRMACA